MNTMVQSPNAASVAVHSVDSAGLNVNQNIETSPAKVYACLTALGRTIGILMMNLAFPFATVVLVALGVHSEPVAAQETTQPESVQVQNADVSDGPPEPAQKVDVVPHVADEKIRNRIKKILIASKWFHNVEVQVDEGIVFLEGQATEEKHREWAANMCRNVQDVVAVVNNMTTPDKSSFDLQKSSNHISRSLQSLWRDFLERLPLMIVGLIVLVATWGIDHIAAIVVRRSARQARLRTSLQDLLVQLSTFVVWVVGLMVAAVVVFPGMTPAKLLTVLGLGSVALGFAFKDIFENFFAGILILWRFPFDRGDFIECDGISGKVEDVTIRMSVIRQVDGQLVVVPNAALFKNPVNVLTSDDLRRTTIICGVAYGEDVDECRRVIEDAVNDCPTVAQSRPAEIFAQEFAASSVNFEVTWWTGSTPLEIRRSRDEVVASVKRSLDEAGIEIPFPYRTLTFKQPLNVHGQIPCPESIDSPDEATTDGNAAE